MSCYIVSDKQVILLAAHRLAFLYMTGRFPKVDVDHEDTIKHHNWWSNLREATRSQNMQNQRKSQLNNKLGLLGVHSQNGKFIAQIGINGKQTYIGNFNTPEEAHIAYLNAKRELHEYNTL